jgi:hypothetical protein
VFSDRLRDSALAEYALFVPVLAWTLVLLIRLAGESHEGHRASIPDSVVASLPLLVNSAMAVAGVAALVAIVLFVPLAGLIAAFYFFVRFQTAIEFVVIGRFGAIAALRQAWRLTRGQSARAFSNTLLQQGITISLALLVTLALPWIWLGPIVVVAFLPWITSLRVAMYFDLLSSRRSI